MGNTPRTFVLTINVVLFLEIFERHQGRDVRHYWLYCMKYFRWNFQTVYAFYVTFCGNAV